MKTIAIIPARGNSKRLPRKNILPLNGNPLLAYPVKAALESKLFDHVIVSTEDSEIASIAKKHGAEVSDRPAALAEDKAHELEACMHTLDEIKKNGHDYQAFCMIYATAAFITKDDLQKSFPLLSGPPEADVVMCVSEFNYHPYKALTKNKAGYLEMMYPKECRQSSQTYPAVASSNGTFSWLRTSALRANPEKGYYQNRLVPFTIPYERAIDIDTREDFEKAKQYMAFLTSANDRQK